MVRNDTISPSKITHNTPIKPQNSAMNCSLCSLSRSKKKEYRQEIDGTSAKITLIFSALVYLSERNMAQKNTTIQPLMREHRQNKEKEKCSP